MKKSFFAKLGGFLIVGFVLGSSLSAFVESRTPYREESKQLVHHMTLMDFHADILKNEALYGELSEMGRDDFLANINNQSRASFDLELAAYQNDDSSLADTAREYRSALKELDEAITSGKALQDAEDFTQKVDDVLSYRDRFKKTLIKM